MTTGEQCSNLKALGIVLGPTTNNNSQTKERHSKMAKKQTQQTPEYEDTAQTTGPFDGIEDDPTPGMAGEVDLLGDTDLSDADEYKILPLVPNGLYEGEVRKVSYDSDKKCITWSIELSENDGALCVDEETPARGAYVYYRNWLPKADDDKIMTKSGRQTKKQAKLNMLGDFAKGMGFPSDSPRDTISYISEGIADQSFIGLEVIVKGSISEYEGRLRNQVDSMVVNE